LNISPAGIDISSGLKGFKALQTKKQSYSKYDERMYTTLSSKHQQPHQMTKARQEF